MRTRTRAQIFRIARCPKRDGYLVFGGMSMIHRRRVVIVGAGYAGALCAARLARKLRKHGKAASIAIVDPRSHFVERVRLHEDAAAAGGGGGGRSFRPRVPLAHLLRDTGVEIWTGFVRDVDLGRRRLSINDDRRMRSRVEAFDDLVIATGSTAAGDDVPGVREHACRVGTEEDAFSLSARLDRGDVRSVVICGGGLTGIELATEIAERRRGGGTIGTIQSVTLVTSSVVGPSLGESARHHVRASIDRTGARLVEHASIVAVERDGVVLADGNVIAADCVVWCGGLRPSTLPRAIGLATDPLGRAYVDAHLRSTGRDEAHSFVHVVGDAARFEIRPGEPLRMACATANPMGAYCADDLAREIAGGHEEPSHRPPFRFAYALQCVSLGRKNAIVQRVDAFDTPIVGTLRGRPAAWIKEGLCRFAIGAGALERMGIPYLWPQGPRNRGLPLPAASTAPRLGSS